MGFAQALGEQVRRSGTKCRIAEIRGEMTPDDSKALDEAFADPKWLNSQILRALKAEGFEIGASSVSRHRKGDCICGAT